MLSSHSLLVAVLASSATAQTTTLLRPRDDTTSITVLVAPDLYADVVTADACSTVLAFDCDQFSQATPAAACATATDFTLTFRSTGYEFSYTSTGSGKTLSEKVSCSFRGTSPTYSDKVCVTTSSESIGGSSTTTAITGTSTGLGTAANEVYITAGASKLPSGSQSCTIKGNAAAPTAVVEVYKVLVRMGAALAAGAALL